MKRFLKETLEKIYNKIIMENFWTSKNPINGLRHFVLLNEIEEERNVICLMVSVIDSEINLKITIEELFYSGNWERGWLKLSKLESITSDYLLHKSSNKGKERNKIFINDNYLFNIS